MGRQPRSAPRNRLGWYRVALLLVGLLGGVAVAQSAGNEPGAVVSKAARPSPLAAARATEGGLRHLVAFEANRGQTDAQVQFLARGAGYTVFLTSGEAVLAVREPGGPAVVRMKLVGATPSPRVAASDRVPGTINYVRGDDPEKWLTDVPAYATVTYHAVYPGIDLVYHGNQRQLEYDFVVAPGGDPTQIRLAFEGVRRLTIDARGDLILRTAGGELRKRRPVAYQEVDGVRTSVSARYVIADGDRVAVETGEYDRSRPLVIDPILLYSTYLAGTGDDGWVVSSEVGSVTQGDIAVDAQGNTYVTGTTASTDFPGAGQPAGGLDVFVTKLNASGALVYSTYLGGECDDEVGGIAVDTAGNAYVTGRTGASCTLPVSDGVFVAKLDPTGAHVYWFTFGGSLGDISRGQAIAVDSTTGHAYVTGLAWSSSGDFPTTDGAYRRDDCRDPMNPYAIDAFVAKVNAAGDGLLYSTYLCGAEHESANGIAIDGAGNAYVVGSTSSRDFPVTNAYQGQHRAAGPADVNAFLAKLNAAGSVLVYSTYLGGSLNTVAADVAVDSAGSAYVTGWTEASDFPTTAGVLQPTFGNFACYGLCNAAFVTKFSPAGSGLAYSTYLYGEQHTLGHGIDVDTGGNAYVVGKTQGRYFPHVSAFQSTKRGGVYDAFVAKLNPAGTALGYSSYLGGGDVHGYHLEGEDIGLDIAVDDAGNAHVMGATTSFDFPTRNAVQPNFIGGICGTFACADAFVTKIAASGPGVTPPVRVSAAPGMVPVGGAVTATWAGIPVPTASDVLYLNPLGTSNFDAVDPWPTTGAASGSLALTLPATVGPGWYELRLLSPDPTQFDLLDVIARSEPFRVFQASPPNAPTGLGQFKADGITALPVGAWTDLTTVVVKLAMSDPNNPDTLTSEVEIKPLTTAFNGAGLVAGSLVTYTGTPRQGLVTVTGLTTGTQYHWRARVKDAGGQTSAWVSFGGNLETARDVGVANPTGLATPAPLAPPNGATGVALPPKFSWSAVNSATAYWIMVATSQGALPRDPAASACTGCVINALSPGNSYASAAGVLKAGTKYWWQVKARTTDGTQVSAWSTQLSFTSR